MIYQSFHRISNKDKLEKLIFGGLKLLRGLKNKMKRIKVWSKMQKKIGILEYFDITFQFPCASATSTKFPKQS